LKNRHKQIKNSLLSERKGENYTIKDTKFKLPFKRVTGSFAREKTP